MSLIVPKLTKTGYSGEFVRDLLTPSKTAQELLHNNAVPIHIEKTTTIDDETGEESTLDMTGVELHVRAASDLNKDTVPYFDYNIPQIDPSIGEYRGVLSIEDINMITIDTIVYVTLYCLVDEEEYVYDIAAFNCIGGV